MMVVPLLLLSLIFSLLAAWTSPSGSSSIFPTAPTAAAVATPCEVSVWSSSRRSSPRRCGVLVGASPVAPASTWAAAAAFALVPPPTLRGEKTSACKRPRDVRHPTPPAGRLRGVGRRLGGTRARASPSSPPLRPDDLPDAPSSRQSPDEPPPPPTCGSPLSMTIEELGLHLGGTGRALAAWDCLRIGVDPLLYGGSDVDGGVNVDGMSVAAVLGSSDGTPGRCGDTKGDVTKLLPSKRADQGLGRDALDRLRSLLPPPPALQRDDHSGGRMSSAGVEGGVATLSHVDTSSDGTTKLLLRMASDGLEVEAVIIPWDERGRSTLCLSSQVGCRQGCTFCATGRMGKLRSLTSDEILCQMFYATKICRLRDIHRIDNVVFMGMGEPADNVDAVVRAATVLTDQRLFQLAQSKVTVSTVAPSPDAFRRLAAAPAALAWSVHAADDGLRRVLVPTTRHSMDELRAGFVGALNGRPRRLRTTMLEVALIDGVNDSDEAAEALASFALKMVQEVQGIKMVVNIIPFNDIGHPFYRKPSRESVSRFQSVLTGRGLFAFVRTTRGDDESAACGQLATKKRKEKAVGVV